MAELIAKTPADGLLPVATDWGVTLSEAAPTPIWAVMPYRGRADALSSAMQKTHGLAFPAPGETHAAKGARAAWSGLDQCFLFGLAPDQALAEHAALVDQSDAWAHLVLDGPDAADVLARLVPIDLSKAALPVGGCARTALGHMQTLLIRTGADCFEILVFRSMAATAVREINRAMRMVAARRAL